MRSRVRKLPPHVTSGRWKSWAVGGLSLMALGTVGYVLWRRWRSDSGDDDLFSGEKNHFSSRNVTSSQPHEVNTVAKRNTTMGSSVESVTDEQRLEAIQDVKNVITLLGGTVPESIVSDGQGGGDDKDDDSYVTDIPLELQIADEMEHVLRSQIIDASAALMGNGTATQEDDHHDDGVVTRKRGKGGRKGKKADDPRIKLLELALEYLEVVHERKKLKTRFEEEMAKQAIRSDAKSVARMMPHAPNEVGSMMTQRRNVYGDDHYDDDDDEGMYEPWNDEDEDGYYDNEEEWEEGEDDDDEEDYDEDEEDDEEMYSQAHQAWLKAHGIEPDDIHEFGEDDDDFGVGKGRRNEAMADMVRAVFEKELLEHVKQFKVQWGGESNAAAEMQQEEASNLSQQPNVPEDRKEEDKNVETVVQDGNGHDDDQWEDEDLSLKSKRKSGGRNKRSKAARKHNEDKDQPEWEDL